MGKQKIDIKSLTSEIKNRHSMKGALDISEKNRKLYGDRSEASPTNSGDFLDKIRGFNSRKDYQMDRFIYVDHDIHEVLSKIKATTKLKISYLASSLLEEFIIKHKGEIQELLSKKQNKFLD